MVFFWRSVVLGFLFHFFCFCCIFVCFVFGVFWCIFRVFGIFWGFGGCFLLIVSFFGGCFFVFFFGVVGGKVKRKKSQRDPKRIGFLLCFNVFCFVG